MKRYTNINQYYTQDNTTGKKYNHTETCQLLNHQERIIQMKTEIIKKLTKTITVLEKQLKQQEK